MSNNVRTCLIGVNYKNTKNTVTEANYNILYTTDKPLESYKDVSDELELREGLHLTFWNNSSKYDYLEVVNMDDKGVLTKHLMMLFDNEDGLTVDTVEHEYRFITGCATGTFINTVDPSKDSNNGSKLLNMLYFKPKKYKRIIKITDEINKSDVTELKAIQMYR